VLRLDREEVLAVPVVDPELGHASACSRVFRSTRLKKVDHNRVRDQGVVLSLTPTTPDGEAPSIHLDLAPRSAKA
jgi:hypothetical protein